MSKRPLYDLLDVAAHASAAEIKAAYRLAAKRAHPDSGGDSEHFIALTRAYNVLSDAEQRSRYDETGAFDAGAVDNSHADMIMTLSQALDQILATSKLPVENTDIIGEMRKLVKQSRDMTEQGLSGVDKRLHSLGVVRKRIVRKDEAQNLFLTVIDAQIAGLSVTQTAGRRALKAQRRAFDELQRYDSIVDVIRFVQSGLYTSRPDDDFGAFFRIIVG